VIASSNTDFKLSLSRVDSILLGSVRICDPFLRFD
jgi:hypothetical protein